MNLIQALTNLSAAALAVADALKTEPLSTPEPEASVEPRLPCGERVLDRARRLYQHAVAAWAPDKTFVGKDVLDLQVDEETEFYLVHWPGTKKCAIVFSSNGGSGNLPWRIQEFKADIEIETYLKKVGKWSDSPEKVEGADSQEVAS